MCSCQHKLHKKFTFCDIHAKMEMGRETKAMTYKNYFSSNIKYLRKIHNLTQKQLAERLHKTPNAVSNWEQGIRSPIVADIISICNYFSIDFTDLMETDLTSPIKTDPLSLLNNYLADNKFADFEVEELIDYAKWIVNKRSR